MLYRTTEVEGSKTITLVFKRGMPVTVSTEHSRFGDIEGLLSSGDLTKMSDDEVLKVLQPEAESSASKWVERQISVGEYNLTPYGLMSPNGDKVDTELSKKLSKVLGEDPENEDRIRAMVRFLVRAKENPSMPDSDKLYRWIFSEKLTLTPDGHFLGYKSVARERGDGGNDEITLPNGDIETLDYAETMSDDFDTYWSHFAGGGITNGVEFPGQVPQWYGAVVEMPRDKVDSRGHVECSVGLHVGTYGYASQFYAGDSSQLLLVKVDPKDVVSVPDYDFTKLRACRYTVVGEVEDILDVDLWVDEHFAPEIELENSFEDGFDKYDKKELDLVVTDLVEEMLKRIREIG